MFWGCQLNQSWAFGFARNNLDFFELREWVGNDCACCLVALTTPTLLTMFAASVELSFLKKNGGGFFSLTDLEGSTAWKNCSGCSVGPFRLFPGRMG